MAKKKKEVVPIPEDLVSLIRKYTDLLVEMACVNGRNPSEGDNSGVTVFCAVHATDHLIRAEDRRLVWDHLKNSLTVADKKDYAALMNMASNEFTRQLNVHTGLISSIRPKAKTPVQKVVPTIYLTEEEAKEFWECARKNSYLSQAVAKTTIAQIPTSVKDLEAYSCSWGDHWHIGHPIHREVDQTTEYYHRNKLAHLEARELTRLQDFKIYVHKRRRRQEKTFS